MYEPRTYRHWVKSKDLVSFNVLLNETDLLIHATSNLKRKALKSVIKYRSILESYIERHPSFLTAIKPLPVSDDSPHIVSTMSEAAKRVGVGPMAAVAGAIAEYVGRDLLEYSDEVIVENGGDIFIKSSRERVIGIYAGDSTLSGQIGIIVNTAEGPLGVCTSSGTVGHSMSYGVADAVIVISRSAILADAAATSLGNMIKTKDDISKAIDCGKNIEGLNGLIIIKGNDMGIWGNIKLCPMQGSDSGDKS